MALEFIDLTEVNPADPDYPHNSHLSISEKYSGLRVGGVLAHGFKFEPRTVAAARKLIAWLEGWIEKRDEDDARAEILASVARTLFVTAYADACEDDERPEFETPGHGVEWFDVAPDETPADALEVAQRIADDFEGRNGRRLEAAGVEWSALDFHYGGHRAHGLEAFGHALAMTYIGSGVGLWDDFKGENPDGFETGHAEFYL